MRYRLYSDINLSVFEFIHSKTNTNTNIKMSSFKNQLDNDLKFIIHHYKVKVFYIKK